jgi:hypothetical protein
MIESLPDKQNELKEYSHSAKDIPRNQSELTALCSTVSN